MKSILLRLFAPNYLADMPEDKPGVCVASWATTSPFRPPINKGFATVKGLRKAYKVARWGALMLDWDLPRGGAWKEVGVEWRVEEA